MHAHGVEILDGADNHKVVAEIAHHFEFVFLPAQDGFFDERFVHRAHVQSMGNGFAKFFFVVGDGAAGSPQRERRANYQRKSQLIAKPQRIFRVVHQGGRRHFQPDFAASVLEPQTVFRNFDGAERRSDHLHFVFFEDAAFGKFDGQVQRRLSSDCRQQSIGFFARDDFFEIFLRQRLDVGAMREFRVGHDGGGIRIDQHHFVSFGAERLARLSTGIVEFASLADNDRAGPDNQNLFDILALRHILR